MRILLVRHGESIANLDKTVHLTTPDHAIPLSELGHAQARETGRFLGQWFEEHLPDVFGTRSPRLWVSPYKRTRQTADGIEEGATSVSPMTFLDRREHILLVEQQFGLFDGLTDEQLMEQFPKEHAHYAKCEQFEGRFWARMPLGESRFDVSQRVHQAFGTFHRDAEKHGVKDIVVVTHGTAIRAFLMAWLHKSPEWFEAEPNPKNGSVRLLVDDSDEGVIFTPRASLT